MGSCDLPVSSGSSPTKGDQEDTRPEDQGDPYLPTVAHSTVVGVVTGDDGGTSHVAATLQNHPANSRRHSDLSLPGSSGGTACYRQEFSLSKSSHDLDEADLDFLSKHLAPQTASGYGYTFRKFRLFCEQLQADPLTCAPAIVVKYLRHLFESGAEYSTVNFHRSGISKFHVGIDGISIGEHPLVSQAVKAVFRLRPPLPKYQSTFDMVPVLAYVQSLPTTGISLQLLTFKTLFLTIYSSISRVSSVARLGPSLQEHRDSVVLHFVSLEKQARVGNTRGYLQIPRFPEDPELCPVRTLITYFNKVTSNNFDFSDYILAYFQVSGIRGDSDSFFVSYVAPHKSVTSKTLSRWIKSILSSAGVDTQLWDPHAVRSAASAHQSAVRNLDLGQICRLADWSLSSGVYQKFYNRYV